MKKLIIILISVISMYPASAQIYTDQYIKDATKVAETWLNDINNKDYKNAFKLLSNDLKKIYQEEIWINQIIELINEFGTLESRLVTEKKFQSKIEGMEDGFFVFIDYKTNFTNTVNHNEHILLKQNDKKKWEIVDYTYEFQNKQE